MGKAESETGWSLLLKVMAVCGVVLWIAPLIHGFFLCGDIDEVLQQQSTRGGQRSPPLRGVPGSER
jgi:hypothetical protein